MQNLMVEDTTRAMQTADLLLRDLRVLNESSDAVTSLLVSQEIEKTKTVRAQLGTLRMALLNREKS